jgi:hypothetical protein
MSAQDLRRRLIQEMILKDLAIRFEVLPGVAILWREILYGFSTAIIPYTEDEIRTALADLVERGLILSSQREGAGILPATGFEITPRGRDFLSAGCPWNRLLEF